MYTICSTCRIKRNIVEAPSCPVCNLTEVEPTILRQKSRDQFYDTPASVDAFLNQFPLKAFERTTRKAHEVAVRKQIIKTLHDFYGWKFPRIAELFQYSDHTTVLHLYNQK